jgi:hypothetical protein
MSTADATGSGRAQQVYGNAQATLIAALGNNILIFSGLLVAGVFALLSGEASKGSPYWVVEISVGVLVLSLLAGMLALIATMKAHNLSRRAERLASGEDLDDTRIRKARRLAVSLSIGAFFVTLAAMGSASILVGGLVLTMKRDSTFSGFSGRAKIETKDGLNILDLHGNIRELQTEESNEICKIRIKTDQINIEVDGTKGCIVQR